MKSPVIVAGIPRSGTSAIARILHIKCGVNMGNDLLDEYPLSNESKKKLGNWREKLNPEGFYESMELFVLSTNVRNGRYPFDIALLKLQSYFKRRMEEGSALWGFKDPRLCSPPVFSLLLSWFDRAYIIFTYRNNEKTLSSMTTKLGYSEAKAKAFCKQKDYIKMVLKDKPHVEIDMSEKLSDDEIIEKVWN